MQEVVAVDIGNSGIKLAVANTASAVRIDSNLDNAARCKKLATVAADLESPVQWLVCSVDKEQTAWLEDQVSQLRPDDDIHVISASDIPLESSVVNRAALGRDRLLASWYAAVVTDRDVNSIIVDAGTAVTIDVVIADRGHIGGLIFPGSQICLSAVSAHTDALPDLTIKPSPTLSQEVQLGDSTAPAILLGVHQLQLFGIVAMVKALEKQHREAFVFCCGGALDSVSSLLPESWKYDRDFLLEAIFWLKRYL